MATENEIDVNENEEAYLISEERYFMTFMYPNKTIRTNSDITLFAPKLNVQFWMIRAFYLYRDGFSA